MDERSVDELLIAFQFWFLPDWGCLTGQCGSLLPVPLCLHLFIEGKFQAWERGDFQGQAGWLPSFHTAWVACYFVYASDLPVARQDRKLVYRRCWLMHVFLYFSLWRKASSGSLGQTNMESWQSASLLGLHLFCTFLPLSLLLLLGTKWDPRCFVFSF